MANTVSADALIEAFAAFVNSLSSGVVEEKGTEEKPVSKKSKPEPEVEAEVDEETGEVTLDREKVEGLPIVALRKLAKENGIDAKKKADILEAFEEKGFFADSDEEDDEEEDDDDVEVEEVDDDEADDEEDDEEDERSRADLEELTLRELKALAKKEGHTQEDIKGLDQDGLIDLILGEEDEDEDDEDDEEEEEDEDDDDEEVTIDEATLTAMSDAELRQIAKEFDIKLPKKANHKTMVRTILDAAEDDD